MTRLRLGWSPGLSRLDSPEDRLKPGLQLAANLRNGHLVDFTCWYIQMVFPASEVPSHVQPKTQPAER